MESSLRAVEIKAFVPAQNYKLSQTFYQDMGFEMKSEGGGVSYFAFGNCSFLLQDFCVKEFAENLMMHLLVEDVQAWYDRLKEVKLAEKYKIKITEPEEQPWKMIDFIVIDPSGVLWRIGQNI